MAAEIAEMLSNLAQVPVRQYSTFNFGRDQDAQCLSVVVPQQQARILVKAVREQLPPGYVAFVGTSRWLGKERHGGPMDRLMGKSMVEVAVGRGTSQWDILRLARSDAVNYDMETEQLIKRMQELDQICTMRIWHAETDTIEAELSAPPADVPAFAKQLYDLCPDMVDQGVGTLDNLEKSLRKSRDLFFWWD